MSPVLTLDNFARFLSSPYKGFGALSWDAREFENPSMYKPPGFRWAHGEWCYCISIIDDDFEVLKFPRRGNAFEAQPINDDELSALEQTFREGLRYFGWTESFESRYAGVQPEMLTDRALADFLQAIDPMAQLSGRCAAYGHGTAELMSAVVDCAKAPLAFFQRRAQWLAGQLDVSEPVPGLHRIVLLRWLASIGALEAVGAHDTAATALDALRSLMRAMPRDMLGGLALRAQTPDELFELIARRCEQRGWRLADLGGGVDGGYLLAVTALDAVAFERLCASLQLSVRWP